MAALGLSVGLVVTAAPAAHASDQLQVRYVGSVNDDLGTLQVVAESGSDITAVSAHIVSYGTGKEVARVKPKDFALSSGDRKSGVWRTKEPLHLDQLGDYRVDVELTDADGDHIAQTSAGQLSYYVVAKFSALTVDRRAIDRDHRDIEVSGTLYERWPTRELRPLAGRQVDIDVDYWTQNTVSTDDAGRFTGSVHLDNGAPVQAVFRATGGEPFVLYGESELVQIGVDQIPTRFISQVSSTDIDDGEAVTLTAKVEQQTAQGWVPLAGEAGGILFGPKEGRTETVGGFTTADDGTFSVTFTPWDGGYFQLALDTTEDPFLQPSTGLSDLVHVHHGAVFTDFSALRTDERTVHAEGHMDFPDGFTPGTVLVTVQRSPDGQDWSELSTVEARWDGTGYYFFADLEGSGEAQYRAVYEGGDGFQDAVTDSALVAG
ncbi:hypothetical protein SAMN05216252_1565 [Actinacidiphila glaucinigra]|uniref:Uncharacterized protein n=1 Tax=Actinacidiphila glaucinigra TaxID=235986 RepID=A0A239NXB9_9ACTN|nr:hypothetical protein SAMN05216252_1565 [Actinacidiphila glaucinigra]